MRRKKYSVALAALLAFALMTVQTAHAASAVEPGPSESEKQAKFTEKVRLGVARIGVGKEARVEVKRADKVKLAGYISEAGPDSFVVTNLKTGVETTVPYAAVTQIKGHNLGTGAKIAIGIAIGAGIVLIILAIWLNCCTG